MLPTRFRSPEFIRQSDAPHKAEECVPRVGPTEDPEHRADKEDARADAEYGPSLLITHRWLYLPW